MHTHQAISHVFSASRFLPLAVAAGLVGLVFAVSTANADDPIVEVTYVGEASIPRSWIEVENWDPEVIPGENNAVLVNVGPSGSARLQVRGPRTVHSFAYTDDSVGNQLRLEGEDGGSLTVANAFVMDGTELTFHNFASAGTSRTFFVDIETFEVTRGTTHIGGTRGLSGPDATTGFSAGETLISGVESIVINVDFRGGNLDISGLRDLGNLSMSDGGDPLSTQDFSIRMNPIVGAGSMRVASLQGGGEDSEIRLDDSPDAGGQVVIYGESIGSSFAGLLHDGPSAQALSLSMQATGVQTLTRENAYSGGTEIVSGTLALVGDGTIGSGDLAITDGTWDISSIDASSYTLASGTILSGAGTVAVGNKNLIVEGALAPGNSIGTLTIDGGILDISNVSSLDFELGADNDSVLLQNGASLTIGTLDFDDFDFITVAGFVAGDYTLISGWDTLTGTLGQTEGLVDGLDASLSLQSNSLVLTVVPEPQTMALLFGTMAALVGGYARKRRG